MEFHPSDATTGKNVRCKKRKIPVGFDVQQHGDKITPRVTIKEPVIARSVCWQECYMQSGHFVRTRIMGRLYSRAVSISLPRNIKFCSLCRRSAWFMPH